MEMARATLLANAIEQTLKHCFGCKLRTRAQEKDYFGVTDDASGKKAARAIMTEKMVMMLSFQCDIFALCMYEGRTSGSSVKLRLGRG
jgi:hypothetical protein